LYNLAGLTSTAPLRKEEEVLRKRLSVLVGAAVMVLSMFAASAPVFAQELGLGACDLKPGNTEGALSPVNPPPVEKPGVTQRDPIANDKDLDREIGRGELIEECA
jgi:hypothetical protein